MRIAVVAPSCQLKRDAAEAVQAIVAARDDCELVIHPQCFLSDGHFAGPDEARAEALVEVMTDSTVDAVWFARGGYGSNRIADVLHRASCDASRAKIYLGYSDAGFLLAGLHKTGHSVAHGPMVQDVLRAGGDAAVQRSLDFIVHRSDSALETGLEGPAMAFNLTVLSNLLGTALEPDLAGHDLLIEEVGEHYYRIDRAMFHVTGSANVRSVRRLRLGRVSDVIENEPEFGSQEEAIVRDWCDRAGIVFGGTADIGHDAANKVVPFGSSHP